MMDSNQMKFFKRIREVSTLLGIFLLFFGCAAKNAYMEGLSFRIVSTSVSKGIHITMNDSFPKEATHVFSSEDTEIISHIRFANLSGSHYLKWEWVMPDGTLYHATEQHPVQTSSDTYASQGTSWHKIPVTEEMTRAFHGRWNVNIYLDDAIIASNAFVINPQNKISRFDKHWVLMTGKNQNTCIQNQNAVTTIQNCKGI